MGQDLTIPKYQPTKPTLAREAAVVADDEEEEEQKGEENKDGDISYSLGFLKKSGNRK